MYTHNNRSAEEETSVIDEVFTNKIIRVYSFR